ncbi:hypothetical protein LOZ80_37905 [Paenibacillus sp. HWE-109]|uniref:hypothetical protein n=1 Tax=Paenibacillus sp. HWE-109 TaxID=1306526 RepID=UPI001EE0BE34|nr:hypothetical protein [Paenibacillus sp. HWE-109]UKS27167.1 hypothetical protein LOZ80_37905 [Paenibacillus sp. HWE-109]
MDRYMFGGLVKSVLKYIFEALFGIAFEEFVPDIAIEIFGIILMPIVMFFLIKFTIEHYKTPKCEHKRRGVCYQCNPLEID